MTECVYRRRYVASPRASQTRQPGPLALRAIGDSLPSSTSSPTYHAAREDTCKPTRVRPIQIRYTFFRRAVHRFCGSDPATISRTRVTRLVSVWRLVWRSPVACLPRGGVGEGIIFVNFVRAPRLPPSRDPRPDPHQALAWAPLSTTATPIFYVQPLACRCASHVCSSARAACWRASSTLAATLG